MKFFFLLYFYIVLILHFLCQYNNNNYKLVSFFFFLYKFDFILRSYFTFLNMHVVIYLLLFVQVLNVLVTSKHIKHKGK